MFLFITSLALAAAASGTSAHHKAPEPKGSLAGLISSEDYPAESLDRNEQGEVAFTLIIDTTGAVSDCIIDKSSGFSSLDSRTCEILRQRAKFKPARDDKGRAFSTEYHSKIAWRIAEGSPPTELRTSSIVMKFERDRRLVSCRVEVEGAAKRPTETLPDCPADEILHRAPEIEGVTGWIDTVIFENRYTIDNSTSALTQVSNGDMLFARQVIRLTIDAEGKLSACAVVQNSGPQSDADTCSEMPKEYLPRKGISGEFAPFTATLVRSVFMHIKK